MLDAFLLCGSKEDVAARVWDYHEAGMQLPILQPLVQNEDQVRAVLNAAVEYGSERGTVATVAPAAVDAATPARSPSARSRGPPAGYAPPASDELERLGTYRLGLGRRIRRRAGAWYEIMRPFSFTASTVPVTAAGALAAVDHRFHLALFIGALSGALLLHIGTNVVNEIYDVRKGIDSITSPRASHALLKGWLTAGGQQPAIAKIDLETAQLHAAFGRTIGAWIGRCSGPMS